ncbi:hypothetical protein WA026_021572 [Henosepilachna vigintioctopunctata]|uniref:Uncharacterized protein n=1 Tax=Henosepilachna vigintioctopunctata TaxID=420089 RepID=A0AAW1VJ49_9CUCU
MNHGAMLGPILDPQLRQFYLGPCWGYETGFKTSAIIMIRRARLKVELHNLGHSHNKSSWVQDWRVLVRPMNYIPQVGPRLLCVAYEPRASLGNVTWPKLRNNVWANCGNHACPRVIIPDSYHGWSITSL